MKHNKDKGIGKIKKTTTRSLAYEQGDLQNMTDAEYVHYLLMQLRIDENPLWWDKK